MRFWARAIARHWIWNNNEEDHKQLLKLDEELFGGTQTKSSVSIEVRHKDVQIINASDIDSRSEGLKYLFYSLIVEGYNKEKQGIAPNSEYLIILRSSQKLQLEKAVATFWLLTYFGALGTRARRGAGSYTVINADGLEVLSHKISFKPGQNMGEFLKDGLSKITQIFGVPISVKTPSQYSTLNATFWISTTAYTKWEDAIAEIGFSFYQFRKATPHRDRAYRKYTMETLIKKAAFGLPVSVWKDNNVNFSEGGNGYSRRASSLLITLIKNESGIHWLVARLSGDFMDSNSSIVFNSKNEQANHPKNFTWNFGDLDSSLIDHFLDKLEKSNKAKKIK